MSGQRVYRVDRRGYSGTSHAAMETDNGLRTLCGRDATGTQWHVSAGTFVAAEIECKRCRANFPFARHNDPFPLLEETLDAQGTTLPTVSEWLAGGSPMREMP